MLRFCFRFRLKPALKAGHPPKNTKRLRPRGVLSFQWLNGRASPSLEAGAIQVEFTRSGVMAASFTFDPREFPAIDPMLQVKRSAFRPLSLLGAKRKNPLNKTKVFGLPAGFPSPNKRGFPQNRLTNPNEFELYIIGDENWWTSNLVVGFMTLQPLSVQHSSILSQVR